MLYTGILWQWRCVNWVYTMMGSLVRSLHVRWHLVPGVPRYNNLLTPIKQPINVRWHLVPGVPHDGIAETVMTNGLIRVFHLHALRVPEEQGIWRGCDGEKGEVRL